jgi:hypothetical protein
VSDAQRAVAVALEGTNQLPQGGFKLNLNTPLDMALEQQRQAHACER